MSVVWKAFDRLIEPLKTWNLEPVLWRGNSFNYIKFGLWTAIGTFFSAFSIFFYLTVKGYPLDQKIAPYFFLGGFMVWFFSRIIHIFSLKGKLFEDPKKYLLETTLYNQGGLIAGVLLAVIAVIRLGLPFNVALDGMAVGAALGLAFGRIGCYNYGCCWGKETNSNHGVVYENPECSVLRNKPHLKGKKLYPTQLMTALFNFLMFFFLMGLMYFDTSDGFVFITFLLINQSGRLWLEYYRDDSIKENERDYLTVLFAVGIVLLSIFLLILDYYQIVEIIAAPSLGPRQSINQSLQEVFLNPNIWKGAISISLIMGILYGIHGKKLGSW